MGNDYQTPGTWVARLRGTRGKEKPVVREAPRRAALLFPPKLQMDRPSRRVPFRVVVPETLQSDQPLH